MSLQLVVAPAVEPVTLAEVATHLRLDTSSQMVAPGAPTAALGVVAGNIDNGAHRYRVTFVTADGETEGGIISGAVTVTDKSVLGKVALSAIPLGGSAVTARKIYRTVAAGSSYFLLATIADNTTTTYLDNIADASLGAGAPTTNTTGDPYLTALIATARHLAEQFTRRALITQTWDWFLDQFYPGAYRTSLPFMPALCVPLVPLQSVSYIHYNDVDGNSQTLAADQYTVDATASDRCGRVVEAFGVAWPSTRGHINDVTVRFVAGYGSAASAVPAPIKHAILIIISDLYNNRESAVVGSPVYDVPMSAKNLLQRYQVAQF